MKKRSLGFSFIITGICLASSVLAAEKAQWGYSGPEGPEHWGELDPQFTVCSTGKNQSPVDLTGMVESELPPIVFNYQSGDNEILNNGHTIQVNYNLANTIRVANMQFSRIRSALNLSEKIVPDKPFIASVIAKQLGAGHEKTIQR